MSGTDLASRNICLRPRYAMSSTHLAYGAFCLLPRVCNVLYDHCTEPVYGGPRSWAPSTCASSKRLPFPEIQHQTTQIAGTNCAEIVGSDR
eukprot:2701381-Rhodomonas_salina.3